MSPTMSREHVTRNTQPLTTGYTGRRLVLAFRSFHRIVTLQNKWWQNEKLSCWNSTGFAELLGATMAPDSVFIADLSLRLGETNVTHMSMSTLWRLDGFEEMLDALRGRVGSLRIHTGYDIATDTPRSLDFDFGGGSVVHLITGGVWHDLFQESCNKPPQPVSHWARMVKAIAGLPMPTRNEARMGPLVDVGFECPYDEIVEVEEHWSGEGPSRFTTYATVRTED